MAVKSYTMYRDIKHCRNCGACSRKFTRNPEMMIISEASYKTKGIRRIIYEAIARCPGSCLSIEVR